MTASTNLQNFTHVHLELDPNKVLFAPDNEGVVQYEEWKDIPGYEGYYQCSSFGRVKSLRRFIKRTNHYMEISEKILKQQIPQRYFCVGIKTNNLRKGYQVHQLVAMCFLGHKPNGFKIVVDHKDNIKENNFVWNLQLTTNRHNASKDKEGGTSKYVGVSWNKRTKKWRAVIYHNGKETHLGLFDNEDTASEYYQNALKAIKDGTDIKIKRRTESSSEEGINYQKPRGNRKGSWKARVRISKGKRLHLGSFDTEEEAIKAKYDFLNNSK
tara:strand:+ start:1200 stop:2006 length:807 start_codon:yes stop_codon:yes gene_type:complete